MPAKDTYHNAVRHALIKDGWTITHDPFPIEWSKVRLYADLGAEQLMAAERANRRVVIEIKSFLGPSLMDELEKALGQFILYRAILEKTDPDRELLLALPYDAASVFQKPIGLLLLESNLVRAFSFDPVKEEIVQWIP